MKKVNVIGTTGSGKSTFSQRLATKINAPYIQMDQIFGKKNWQESQDSEFFQRIEEILSESTWVLDGNYSRTNVIKWRDADTIIWIDYSFCRTFFQLFKRTIKRIISGEELWPETGNRESFAKSFLSKKSIFIWFFKNYSHNKKGYSKLMYSSKIKHINVIRLCSPKEADLFLKNIEA
uniref:Adenylate kinase n=1 Tax=Marinomonas sp. (strain MWYL1) TaxID=400668 RepID=A6VSE2_MARMS